MPARFVDDYNVDDYNPRIGLGFAIADGHVGGATCETPGQPNGSASWLQGVGGPQMLPGRAPTWAMPVQAEHAGRQRGQGPLWDGHGSGSLWDASALLAAPSAIA
jgi:hypothetical protein